MMCGQASTGHTILFHRCAGRGLIHPVNLSSMLAALACLMYALSNTHMRTYAPFAGVAVGW
jgi:hypothetical protein